MIQEEYSNYIIFSLVFIKSMYLQMLHLLGNLYVDSLHMKQKALIEEERLLAS